MSSPIFAQSRVRIWRERQRRARYYSFFIQIQMSRFIDLILVGYKHIYTICVFQKSSIISAWQKHRNTILLWYEHLVSHISRAVPCEYNTQNYHVRKIYAHEPRRIKFKIASIFGHYILHIVATIVVANTDSRRCFFFLYGHIVKWLLIMQIAHAIDDQMKYKKKKL